MYSRKKTQGKDQGRTNVDGKEGKGKAFMAQMGMLPDMMTGTSLDVDDDDDDDDLEAELMAIQSGGKPKKAKKSQNVNMNDLDKMVAASMRDIPSDEEFSDGEDADLMAELKELESSTPPASLPIVQAVPAAVHHPTAPSSGSKSQVQLLEERLENYKEAEASARSAGESSKARRVNRGVKTLQDLLKKSRSGRPIDEDDIPPQVAIGSSGPPSEKTTPEEPQAPVVSNTPQWTPGQPPLPLPGNTPASQQQPAVQPRPQPAVQPVPQPRKQPAVQPVPQPTPQPAVQPVGAHWAPVEAPGDAEKHRMLSTRRDQYKAAALDAKKSGNNIMAVKYIKIAKQFDQVIDALEKGDPIDLSKMPPPPPGAPVEAAVPASLQPTERSAMQASASSQSLGDIEEPELSTQEKKKLFNAPETANSTLEAMEQRLEKYKSSQAEAQEESNTSKARRMGRIVKQYTDAVKTYKAGRPLDYDDLPCPPGFPPIPQPKTASPVKVAAPVVPAAVAASSQPAGTRQPAPAPPDAAQKPKMQRQMSAMSRSEQQTIFLQERQLQFKKAAIQAKHNGDMELAKKYLRFAKGFDQMIGASQGGLPVNMSQIPPPPHSGKDEDFEFVEAGEVKGDREEMYKKLEQELIQQIRTCTSNADNFTHLGDVSSATKFDRTGQNCRKDLDALRNAYKHNDPVPRFHYENRQFSMVKCCSDLGENDLEIVILRGLNYGLPSGYQAKDMDTYVKFEFPFPTDDPQCGQTDTHKHTVSPEYNQSFKLQINRKSRVFQRLLKSSKTIKLEVFYKRGFLKGDKLWGTINHKLHGMETSCEVHESADLMDGRKACGGRLEYKIRIRDPFGGKQVEEVKEKWLVIDHFDQALKSQNKPVIRQSAATTNPVPSQSRPAASDQKYTSGYSSIEVLKFERQQLDTQIRRYQGRLNQAEENSLQQKGLLIDRKIEETKSRLQKGGSAAWKAYADSIEKSQNSYIQEAKALAQQGNRDKATILMQKKKLVEKEVEAIRSKLPTNLR